MPEGQDDFLRGVLTNDDNSIHRIKYNSMLTAHLKNKTITEPEIKMFLKIFICTNLEGDRLDNGGFALLPFFGLDL